MIKQDIIETLDFPRCHIKSNLELEQCPYNGSFNFQSQTCHDCNYGYECKWLLHNDEFVAMKEKSLADLKRALAFAIGYVDSFVGEWGHNSRTCMCESCSWLRNTQKLFWKAVDGKSH